MLATSLDWKKSAHSFEQFEMAVGYGEAGNLATLDFGVARL
jgi:hypothetical protein